MLPVAPAAPGKGFAQGPTLWIQGLACGALLTFATPTALLLAVALAPAWACLLGERAAGGTTTRAVALCGAAATLQPLWHLWMQGDHMDGALQALSDPASLVLAWGAGACAWAMCQVVPVVVRTVWEAREAARGRSLEAELARIREEWDLPPES